MFQVETKSLKPVNFWDESKLKFQQPIKFQDFFFKKVKIFLTFWILSAISLRSKEIESDEGRSALLTKGYLSQNFMSLNVFLSEFQKILNIFENCWQECLSKCENIFSSLKNVKNQFVQTVSHDTILCKEPFNCFSRVAYVQLQEMNRLISLAKSKESDFQSIYGKIQERFSFLEAKYRTSLREEHSLMGISKASTLESIDMLLCMIKKEIIRKKQILQQLNMSQESIETIAMSILHDVHIDYRMRKIYA